MLIPFCVPEKWLQQTQCHLIMTTKRKANKHALPTFSKDHSADVLKGTLYSSGASDNVYGHNKAFSSTQTRKRLLCRPMCLMFPPVFLLLLTLQKLIGWNLDPVHHHLHHDARPRDSDCYDAGAPFAPLNIQRLWAAYSPYYSVEAYKPPPQDCRLTQVNIVGFLRSTRLLRPD